MEPLPARPATLTEPRVLRVVVLYVLARIPAAAVWLSIVLDVSDASGSYAAAGGAVAAYGIGVAAVAPFMGRAADRLGARRVLLGCAAVQLPALLLLAASAESAGLALLAPAFIAGAVQPPLVPCMRAGWALLVPDEKHRQSCFAFDAVLGEVVDLGAPIIAVALNVGRGDSGSLRLVAIAVAVTTVLYALGAPSAGSAAVQRPPGQRVITRPVLNVLVVVLLLTAGLGAVEVAVIALADDLAARSSAGVLLGLFTLGSIVGGVVHGRSHWDAAPRRQLLVLLVPLCAALLVTGLTAQNRLLAGLLLALAGVTVAPLVAVLLGLLQCAARPGAVTETFTYATTANFLGVAGGSLLAGVAVDAVEGGGTLGSGTSGLLVAGLFVAAAALAALSVRGRVQLTAEPPATPEEAEALVEELEQLWEQCRLVGCANDALARQIVMARRELPPAHVPGRIPEQVRG